MAFQISDLTAGRILFYIDNAGQLGLGALPVQGQQIAVLGAAVLDTNARFPDGSLRPGCPAAYFGSLVVPAGGSASVNVSVAAPPAVSSTVTPSAVTNSAVTFPNPNGFDVTNNYNIW
ncbi:hypothetical protein BDD14_0690 [Edaphobacter modestus]|uniref:Uncharacterized protein n=1 Tax=Edaphobacter modestus TaxID=388466 RepID=A0A4Q7YQX8_9BACT|nr:hypothetical protein BDD14_0690 [Edaphobacter modestus]